jgi:glycosidase
MTKDHDSQIFQLIKNIYGKGAARKIYDETCTLICKYKSTCNKNARYPNSINLNEKDIILITYADQVQENFKSPLKSLEQFCADYITDIINTIHLLPFYPSSSDDGFSVIDYQAVDPKLGSWEDIASLRKKFNLMFDGVINHTSVQANWFKEYLNNNPHYQDFYIDAPLEADIKNVVRPRALPLITEFTSPKGVKRIWTTFSEDQVDLNYSNPAVFLKVLEVLLFYVDKGAQFIRLDAIAYLWKEFGTSCIHLPQTHWIIQLFRAILDQVNPSVILITETNVPHQDNISYFGDGFNEAQMVYNFALPPLVFHTISTENSATLIRWAANLRLPSKAVTFFNFLASHDGIGLNPARGILQDEEIDSLVNRVITNGGLVSWKSNPDGTKSPYELNINYFDALSNLASDEPISRQVDRFMVSQAIMLAFQGVPGIYFHSLFGSRSWHEGIKLTGRNRTINRQKFNRDDLEHEINKQGSIRQIVFTEYKKLLKARISSPAFHPASSQKVIETKSTLFCILRFSENNQHRVLCVHNISSNPQTLILKSITEFYVQHAQYQDLITKKKILLQNNEQINVLPYCYLWLERIPGK